MLGVALWQKYQELCPSSQDFDLKSNLWHQDDLKQHGPPKKSLKLEQENEDFLHCQLADQLLWDLAFPTLTKVKQSIACPASSEEPLS